VSNVRVAVAHFAEHAKATHRANGCTEEKIDIAANLAIAVIAAAVAQKNKFLIIK
jgi:hypothetical protein